MSEQEIRSRISDAEDEITRVEEDASKKDASAEKEIEADWDENIKETKETLEATETLLKEAIEKSDEWVKKRIALTSEAKSLNKKYDGLVSGKAKALNKKLDNIEKEKKTKIKSLESEIKGLKKQLEKLEEEQLKQQS